MMLCIATLDWTNAKAVLLLFGIGRLKLSLQWTDDSEAEEAIKLNTKTCQKNTHGNLILVCLSTQPIVRSKLTQS